MILILLVDTAFATGVLGASMPSINSRGLYLQMGVPVAMRCGFPREALAGFAGARGCGMRARLFFEEAQALKVLGRFPEAEPIFRQAAQQMVDAGDLEGVFFAAGQRWVAITSTLKRYPGS